MNEPICILATLDKNYIPYFNVMLSSLLYSNPEEYFNIYIQHTTHEDRDLEESRKLLGERGEIFPVAVCEDSLESAPTTDRYPKEIYYRIFAAKYLPENINRVLYLDPDLVVNKSLAELYGMPMGTAFFAAASHIGNLLHFINELRLDINSEMPYINSGVMLIDLNAARRLAGQSPLSSPARRATSAHSSTIL